MNRFSFEAGRRLIIGENFYNMRQKLDGDRWRLEKETDGEILVLSEDNLLEQYSKNIVKFTNENAEILGQFEVKERIKQLFRDYPKKLQDEAKRRLGFVRALEGAMTVDKEQRIKEMAEQMQIEAPSIRTVQRWHNAYQKSEKNICSLVPGYSRRGNRNPRYAQEVLDISVRAINSEYLTKNKKTLTNAVSAVQHAIHQINSQRPQNEKLKKPARKFVRNIIAAMDAYEVDCARLGKIAADRKHREVIMTGERIIEPLQRVEIDHTPLDVILVADGTYLPIGRPTLSVAIDRCTRCVLGFHVSYDPPSYVSVAQCLAHAVTPKKVKSLYPDIQNEWPCWGLPQQVVVDNGAEFHSTDFAAAMMTLLIDIRYCPTRQPWWKGVVERFFRTQNKGLIHTIPGTTFSNIFEKGDYESAKYAVLTESELNELLHMWICDVYHQTQNRQSLRAPASLWRERIVDVIQTLPESVELLKVCLASALQKKIFHYGITLNNLTYNSHELQQLRRKYGKEMVAVRWNRTDVGYIHVLDEHENVYLRVPCTWPEYADGLSLWLHQRIREDALAKDGGGDARDKQNDAKARIRAKIEKAMSSKKLATRKTAARGQQSLQKSKESSDLNTASTVKENEISKHEISRPLDLANIPEYAIEERNT
ncbi:MAG: DDE-type integrase/transposase/recombinase [Geobacter sp.]|nr:DDE-type integrase/transposase/recombinase [Geobacter sp.]